MTSRPSVSAESTSSCRSIRPSAISSNAGCARRRRRSDRREKPIVLCSPKALRTRSCPQFGVSRNTVDLWRARYARERDPKHSRATVPVEAGKPWEGRRVKRLREVAAAIYFEVFCRAWRGAFSMIPLSRLNRADRNGSLAASSRRETNSRFRIECSLHSHCRWPSQSARVSTLSAGRPVAQPVKRFIGGLRTALSEEDEWNPICHARRRRSWHGCENREARQASSPPSCLHHVLLVGRTITGRPIHCSRRHGRIHRVQRRRRRRSTSTSGSKKDLSGSVFLARLTTPNETAAGVTRGSPAFRDNKTGVRMDANPNLRSGGCAVRGSSVLHDHSVSA